MVRQTAVMVERTCDNCKDTLTYNDMAVTPDEASWLQKWFVVAREVWGQDGKPVMIRAHACSKECAKVLIDSQIEIPQGAAN